MKKTNVLFSFFTKKKAQWASLALIGAFCFLGMGTASAQLVPKNATPLQKMQAEHNWLLEKLAPLPPSDPYHATWAPYIAFLEAMIHDMSVAGMSFHAAMANNRNLVPQAPFPAATGQLLGGAILTSPQNTNVLVSH